MPSASFKDRNAGTYGSISQMWPLHFQQFVGSYKPCRKLHVRHRAIHVITPVDAL